MLVGGPFSELRRVNTLSLSVKNLTATIEEEESRAPGASGQATQNQAATKGAAQILRYFHQEEERFRRRGDHSGTLMP